MLTSYHQGNCHFSLNREKVVKAQKAPVEEPQEKPKPKRKKRTKKEGL